MAKPSIDVLKQLLGAAWKEVPFPYTALKSGFTQSHVEHAMPDKDGVHVEATGRNNLIFSASIPFRNGVRPGDNELWFGRQPYPELFRAFFSACVDKTSGPLDHPELGRLTCKVQRFEWDYAPDKRDGCDASVSWTESLDDGDELNGIIAQPSPVSAAIAVAQKLDSQIAALSPPPPELADQTTSFSDMMTAIQAIPDTAALLSKRAGGAIHNIAAKLDRLEAALERLNSVRLWPLVDGLEHMRASIADLTKVLGTSNKVIREYLVPFKTTLNAIAGRLAVNISDLVRLNPNLLDKPLIPAGSRVRYFATQ